MAEPRHKRSVLAATMLIAITAVWGSTFAISKDLLTRMSVPDYLALRFLTAALVVGLIRPAALFRAGWRVVTVGVFLGLIYFLGQLLQYVGLQHTAPTVSAFVVSMYVVFTPLFAAALSRRLPTRRIALATLLAATGVAVMSLRGFAVGWGELLTLIAASLYAVHIIALGRWARAETAYALAVVQLTTMGGVFLAVASIDGIQLPQRSDWPAFLYLALLAGGLAILVQTWAQTHLAAAVVAILMVLEPVWAAVFGLAIFGESLNQRVLIGAALILLGLLVTASTRRRGRVGFLDSTVGTEALGGYTLAGPDLGADPQTCSASTAPPSTSSLGRLPEPDPVVDDLPATCVPAEPNPPTTPHRPRCV